MSEGRIANERVERRLSAIFAGDVVGYSRLMEADEERTLARLNAHRREFLDPTIAQNRGRIVKRTGDGVLIEFISAVDAVRCAVEIQRGMGERNASVPPEARIELRIGIHVGDIMIEDSDIFGDGVNIAARLESIAQPGGICISDDAYRQVRGKIDVNFQDSGEQELKNIARPVRVYQLRPGARAVAEKPSPSGLTLPDKPSIAVLAFQNMSGDAEQEFFADGIAEDIITALSKAHWLFVIARNSSFTYKGKSVDLRGVGRELGVRYVLEGSVRKAGNRVRITAQLIDATSGHHIWAERYDHALEDIFAIQDEITRSIIGAIAPGIIAAEVRQAQRKDPDQLDAWDRTVRAHWHIRRFTRDDLAEACRLLTDAISLDPRNSMAYADLAFARHFEAVFGWGGQPVDSHQQLGEAARKAVLADDNDAMAHTALAIFELFSGRHEEARRRLHRALSLNPNSEFARGYLGSSYAFGGDCEAALPHLEEAIRLSPRDPLVVIWNVCKAWATLSTERYKETVEFTEHAREANPEFPDIYAISASAHGHLENTTAARAALDQLLHRMPKLTASDERLIRPFTRATDRERFLEGLRKAGLPER
jgi:adenylate cyclase